MRLAIAALVRVAELPGGGLGLEVASVLKHISRSGKEIVAVRVVVIILRRSSVYLLGDLEVLVQAA